MHDSPLCFFIALCIPLVGEYRKKIFFEFRDLRIGGHIGFQKAFQWVKSHYYWPSLRLNVYQYIKECMSCLENKYERVKVQLLFPWPIPKGTWIEISMDFLLGLPLTLHKNNAVLVIADQFSKHAHFVPTKNIVTTSECVDLLVKEIFRHHGVS